MSVTVYGPNETWPTHQKAYWRTALKQAQDAGWTLKHLSSPHRFGVVACPTGEHTFDVDSTARGAETKAKEVPKRLRACQHGVAEPTRSKVAARQVECERLLGRAEELINMAAADLHRAEQLQTALAELDRLALLLATADASLNEVLTATQDDALEQAIDLEDAPGREPICRTLDEAEDAAQDAAEVARRLRRSSLGASLSVRAVAAKTRIEDLRHRLAAL